MADEKLKSWKEIADFLHVQPRTAQRWEHEFTLPIHRIGTGKRAIVFASSAELSEWLDSRAGTLARSEDVATDAMFLIRAVKPSSPSGAVDTAMGAALSRQPVPDAVVTRALRDEAALDHRSSLRTGFSRLPLRRSVLLVCAVLITVALAAILLPHANLRELPNRNRFDPQAGTKTAAAASRSPRQVSLRVTLAGGGTMRMGLTVGSLAGVSLKNREPHALSAEPVADGIRVHVFRVRASPPNGSQQFEELTAVSLKPGEKKPLPVSIDIAAIEWVAEGS